MPQIIVYTNGPSRAVLSFATSGLIPATPVDDLLIIVEAKAMSSLVCMFIAVGRGRIERAGKG